MSGEESYYLPQHSKSPGKIAYINARIIDPESNSDFEEGYVITDGDIISEVSRGAFSKEDNASHDFQDVIDCSGLCIIPGIIDIHVHFRYPGQIIKEDIYTGSKAAVRGGITYAVCQPNTSPAIDNINVVKDVIAEAKARSFINIGMYAAITKNIQGNEITNMRALNNIECVKGFTNDGLPVINSNTMKSAFKYAHEIDAIIVQHTEDMQLSNSGCIHEGRRSFELGIPGINPLAEASMIERDIALRKSAASNARYHAMHVSSKENIEIIKRLKERGEQITCEVTPHHFLLNDDEIMTHMSLAKMNPPLRSEQDREIIIDALKNDIIDCIATDHAPHEAKSKLMPLQSANFGITGVETILPLSLRLRDYGMSLVDIIKKITYSPAEIIREERRGRLKKGCHADITIIDPEQEYHYTSQGKSKNTPFTNQRMKGVVKKTIVSGNVAYNNTKATPTNGSSYRQT